MRIHYLLLSTATASLTYPDCQPPDSFTQISFEAARLRRSNLGGLGGRCDNNGALCTEGQTTTSTPRDLYIENVGVHTSGQIDLRIVNESEYRAWETARNGVKRQRGSVTTSDSSASAKPRNRRSPRGIPLTHL